ncbi:unnamed protein product [Mycena citricolor]|uniref:AMMECR1 domain-containing protein n=1 Tax=Mycena citricolor TaxID=2018698 RepID=A0AAD2HH42_9AGAR|nr:unnamed protein product [Mycena citricolor]
MAQYDRLTGMDPYSRSRYEQGVDSKIVVMGNSGVGKTSLLQRYTQNKFEPKNTTSTSGAFFVTKKVQVNGLKVRLQLWDTAGQERFRSMAPMYYRGANAALLLYDITNASTFDDIRGWLQELKKNCPPSLLIYIVGSKADLHEHRQVTPDLARLQLHNWFPPPRPPTPPPPPPQMSTLAYIRPRFTSFPGLRSAPVINPQAKATGQRKDSTESTTTRTAYLDLQSPTTRPSAISRPSAVSSRTGHSQSPPQRSRFGSHFGFQVGGWHEDESRSNSNGEDEGYGGEEDEDEDAVGKGWEWGLSKGMELFEVSAKDDTGIKNLFEHLISAIILHKDEIEQENTARKRDSVFLDPIAPAWSSQADDVDDREKAKQNAMAMTLRIALTEVQDGCWAPDESSDSVCTAEHCFHAFDALYCALTSATPIKPSFADDKYPLFVTWNTLRSNRPPRLRGCIGSFQALTLHDGLAEFALVSAFRDHRFRRIERSELETLECAVSLLTDFEDADSYLDWTLGTHGISISFPHPSLLTATSVTPSPLSSATHLPPITSRQKFSATYLPEIAPEQGWDKREAVDSAIEKAGWNGTITEDLRRSIKLQRYQSRKHSVTWAEYIGWRNQQNA